MTDKKDSATKKLDGIQAARGFAAFLVVITHTQNLFEVYHVRYNLPIPDLSRHIFAILGNAGVDIFFVISGFIITHVTWLQFDKLPPKDTGFEFLLKRVIRVVPLYWIFTTVMVLIFIFFPFLIQSGKTISLPQIMASYFFIPWEVAGDKTPILTVGWSLNYEMLFYFVFALFLKFKKFRALISASVFLAGIMTMGLVFRSWFFGNTIILEFLFGILLTILYRKNLLPRGRGTFLLLGMVCLVLTSFKWGLPTPQMRGLIWGVPATFIVAEALTWARSIPKSLVTLGDISYSLYLTHFFVGVTLARVWLVIARPFPVEILAILELTLPCFVAYLVYRFIERPMHNKMQRLTVTMPF